MPVPSKPMALVVDMCILIRREDVTFKPQFATPFEINAGVETYSTRNWQEIPGLRPWTHSNFIRALSPKDRTALASELVQVMKSGRISPEDCR